MSKIEDTLPPPPDYTIPGLRIQKNVPPADWELTIRSAHKREDWVIHRERKHYEPLNLDTTIQYDGAFYRIHEEQETDSGWVYRLNPWPHGDIMYKTVVLTAEKVAEAEAEKASFERMEKLLTISIYYEILVGFLPAQIQNKMAERLLFSPEHASRKNALLEFFVFFAFSTLLLATANPLAFVSYALCLEGAGRWVHVLGSNEPKGLLLLEGIDWLYRRWRNKGVRD